MKRSYVGIRYPEETKIKVVDAIVKGELLLDEAMEKYGIANRITIVRWLKKYRKKEK